MTIRLAPISSGEDLESIAFAIEVVALFDGEVRNDELEWDIDLIREWYIETEVDAEDYEAYVAEPQLAEDEARQSILARLSRMFAKRSQQLGDAYPLLLEPEGGTLLRRVDDVACLPQTACYFWLSLFRATHSRLDCLLISDVNRKIIHRNFANVFELVAGYAMLSEVSGRVWLLGSSRSVHTLLRRLSHVARSAGTGKPKVFEDLIADQINDNDGGVDLVQHVKSDIPVIQIVGATIQKANRRQKVMGQSARRRIRDFMHQQIQLPIEGFMAVPFSRSDVDEAMCAAEECKYLYDENIFNALGQSVNAGRRDDRHLLIRLRQHTSDLLEALELNERDFVKNCQLAQSPTLMQSS